MRNDHQKVFWTLGVAAVVVVLGIIVKVGDEVGIKEVSDEIPRDPSIKILGEEGARESDPQLEHINIRLVPGYGKFHIAGWSIGAGEGRHTLGSASPLPIQGKVNEQIAVTLTYPATLVVATGHSPIGVNFRENKCIGFLQEFQTFTPPLPLECAAGLGSSLDCRADPKEDISYNTCVKAHRNEPDFFLNTWRFFLGSDKELYRNDLEVIKLYDERGTILDTLSY